MEVQKREKWLELSLKDWINGLEDKYNINNASLASKFQELKKISETLSLSEIEQKVNYETVRDLCDGQFEEAELDVESIYINSDHFYNSGIIVEDRNSIAVAKKVKIEIDKNNKTEPIQTVKSILTHLETLKSMHLFVKRLSQNKYEMMEGQHRLIAFVIGEIEKVKVWISPN